MRLNHINLTVPDVAAARSLFETYFDFKPADIKQNDTLSILHGSDGFILVLMNERMNQQENHSYPDAFHIGFHLQNDDEVNNLYNRLKAGGIPLTQEPQMIRKSLGFYFHHQNLMMEIASVPDNNLD